MSSPKKVWPIGPITNALTHFGGKTVHDLAIANGADFHKADRLQDLYRTGERDGFLTLKAMDSICIDGLGMHPIEVYGAAEYFNPTYDTSRTLKPCRKCGGPKSFGDTSYCSSCVEEAKFCKDGCGTYKGDREDYFKIKYAPDCPNRRSGRRHTRHVPVRKPKAA